MRVKMFFGSWAMKWKLSVGPWYSRWRKIYWIRTHACWKFSITGCWSMSALPKIPVIQRIANQGKTLEIMSVNVKVREKKTFKEEVTIFQSENNSTHTTFISIIVVTETFNEYQTLSISSINITKPNMK